MSAVHADQPESRQTTSAAVLLVDDHRVFTDALQVALDLQPDLRCAAVAHSAHEAFARASVIDVDVAVVDLDLPDAGGLDVIADLRAHRPDLRIVVLTAHARPDLAERALAAGAAAFLSKGSSLHRILTAIRSADCKHPVLDTEARRPSAERVALTHREHDVLRQLGLGLDAHRIAAELGIAVYTVRGHMKSVMAKLGVHSQLGAVVAAGRLGLISVGSRY